MFFFKRYELGIGEIIKNSTFDEFLKLCENIPNEKFNEPIEGDPKGNYPLHVMCGSILFKKDNKWSQNEYLQGIKFLVEEKKVNINCENNILGKSKPIHFLCSKSDTLLSGEIRLQAIKYLIDNNADLESCYSGLKPIHLLFSSIFNQYDFKALYYMVEKGVSINTTTNIFGQTLDHLICAKFWMYNPESYYTDQYYRKTHDIDYEATFEAFKYLINKCVDLNKQDVDGKTPLHYLCYDSCFNEREEFYKKYPIDKYPITKYHKRAILYILNKGADPEICCNKKIKPIDEICKLFQQDYLKQNVAKYVTDLVACSSE